jgi:hypothetical protein
MKTKLVRLFLAPVLLSLACSSNQSTSVPSGLGSDQLQANGALRLSMSSGDDATDTGLARKSVDSVDHIYITIKEVQLHVAGDTSDNGWKTVATPNQRFDFLTLVNGLTAPLDLYSLPAGHYTQIRLILGDEWMRPYWDTVTTGAPNEIVVNGKAYPLTIPSAYNTGIKCVRSFFIAPNEVTEICLRFEVRKAVHFAPGNGWMMKPAFQTFKCDSLGNQADDGKKNNNGNKNKTVPDTTNDADDGIIHYPLE